MLTMYLPPPHVFPGATALYLSMREQNVSKPLLLLFLNSLAEPIFDLDWYRAAYPDVVAAVRGGVISSEFNHFVDAGYWEGRMPCFFNIDETWYQKYNPDVSAGVKSGSLASGSSHYNSKGYFEGRFPKEPVGIIEESWYYAVSRQVAEISKSTTK